MPTAALGAQFAKRMAKQRSKGETSRSVIQPWIRVRPARCYAQRWREQILFVSAFLVVIAVARGICCCAVALPFVCLPRLRHGGSRGRSRKQKGQRRCCPPVGGQHPQGSHMFVATCDNPGHCTGARPFDCHTALQGAWAPSAPPQPTSECTCAGSWLISCAHAVSCTTALTKQHQFCFKSCFLSLANFPCR